VHGGVIYYWTELKQTGLLRLMNCLVIDNFTLLERGNITIEGGGNLIASNCLFAGNQGMSNGDVLFSFGKVPASNRIVNNVFIGNMGGYLMGGDAFGPRWVELLNNNFYNNTVRGLFYREADRSNWKTVAELNQVAQSSQNFEIDPGYRRGGEGNWLLQPSTNLFGKATVQTTFPLDLYGKRRNIEEIDGEPPVTTGPIEVRP
jgi:hypothetical protein